MQSTSTDPVERKLSFLTSNDCKAGFSFNQGWNTIQETKGSLKPQRLRKHAFPHQPLLNST